MKRVVIWKPELKRTQKGTSVVTEIVKKKGTEIEERAIMDRTFELAERGGDAWIIENNKYFEEVEMPKQKKELDLNKDIEEMTVPELKAKCDQLDLPKSGTKDELLERLTEEMYGNKSEGDSDDKPEDKE